MAMVPTHRRPRPPTPPQSNQKEAFEVPKMKSHTGMGKRVKVTGSGKLVTEQVGKRHRMEGKSSHVTRRMTGTVVVAKADTKRIKKMLGR